MKNILKIFTICGVVLFVVSCDLSMTRSVTPDLSDYQPKGVIFSLLTNLDDRDTLFRSFRHYMGGYEKANPNQIFISHSLPAGSRWGEFYKAKVKLSSDERDLDLEYQDGESGHGRQPSFLVEDVIEPGKSYTVEAQYEEIGNIFFEYFEPWDRVEASDVMPKVTSFTLENAKLKYESAGNLSPKGGYIDLRINDEIDPDESFLIDISAKAHPAQPSGQHVRVIHSYIDRPEKVTDIDIFDYDRDELFLGEEFSKDGKKRIHFTFNTKYSPYDRDLPMQLFVRVTRLSDHYARFLKTADQNDALEDNPFAEPVEVHLNVKNGYGVFALASRSYGRIEAE